MNYLLDTHIWVWMHLAPEQLSTRVRNLLISSEEPPQLLLSTISLVELATLAEKGRIRFTVSFDQWVQEALAAVSVRLIPVRDDIARETGRLAGLDHYDPADRILVATARLENAVLLTADRTLRRYRHLKTLW